MTVQIPVPYQKCWYNCPFCCARNNVHQQNFVNLHDIDIEAWEKALLKAVSKDSTVVITGDCDPTQDPQYVKDVMTTLMKAYGEGPWRAEFTTHNFAAEKTYFCEQTFIYDVITYSITNYAEYMRADRIPKPKYWTVSTPEDTQYRMVIDLTKEFAGLTPENFDVKGFDQVTFKVLQHSEDPEVNAWIDANAMKEDELDNIKAIVDKLNAEGNVSARLDTTCQTGEGRYKIFRCDGNLYNEWADAPSNTERINKND